ncbi:amidase domain-containing protein [Brevibacillus sp. GCM10020057]|uniref:amidase domain-containing protein n=1 Tax=Brevibacillus sp. GCM10020057 TaxID=3317327 RepID=UPI003638B340
MDWRTFVHRYFNEVHKSWLDGRYERLVAYYSPNGREAEWERMRREYRQLQERGGKARAVQGKVVLLCWLETEQAMDILLAWQGQRCYDLGQEELVERGRRVHRLRLIKGSDEWLIDAHQEWAGDAKAPQDKDAQEDATAAAVEAAAAGPILVVHGAGGYNRKSAVAYAMQYWNSHNPLYPRFTDDCTNFISQCLYAGGIPMLFSKEKGKGWWIRMGKGGEWSWSWTVAHALYLLLKSGAAPMRAVSKSSPDQLEPGDLICYDFDGDGRFQHNTIVVAKDANNMPLVNAHTTDSSMRYWAYEDSTAYTPNIRYAFFQIRGM